MFETTDFCAETLRADSASQAHSEFESGFLLPQLMGLSFNEPARAQLTEGARACPVRGLVSRLMRVLKLRA
ncbi:hypothetical protein HNO86_20320 [Pseudomonas sp. C1C7]|uniref:hypothetical protein n=1 Tax=Pseudomonas sp. C1C7 TaxID=2735272 RepID=UPI001586D0CC|nr:hypothetical protein [Pseudomonas sp. C1C7]NUT77395.1 hypothetical protein [Pseudomonas sp. C1C7]